MAGKTRPDPVGQPCCDQPVDGVTLGLHGAALGQGDFAGDAFQFWLVADRHSAGTQLQGGDQGAVDNQVGVTADRRGEMGITAQIEAKMADIVDGIFGLRLGAKHNFIDQDRIRGAFEFRQHMIELFGAD
jgi:hypothetical protein